MRGVGNPYRVTEVSYPFLVLRHLDLEVGNVCVIKISVGEVAQGEYDVLEEGMFLFL